ncbi:Crp/Fnr family transcriptional regulator [Spirosoma daeguense]
MEQELFAFIGQYLKLTDEEKNVITHLALFHSFKKGTVLLKEGESSKQSYFVMKGCLRCYHIIEGEERTTEFYTEAESCTPICVVNKKPSDYYVACVEDSILLVTDPSMEQIVFEKFPRFETLCRILSEQLLAKNQNAFADFKNASPEQRYLNLLEIRPDLIQRIPLRQLASYLGMKPESLSRIRRRISQVRKG